MGYNILHPVEGSSRVPYPFLPVASPRTPLASSELSRFPGTMQFLFFLFLSTCRSVTDPGDRRRDGEGERSLSRVSIDFRDDYQKILFLHNRSGTVAPGE